MDNKQKLRNLGPNPFENAFTKEEKELVWKALKSRSVRISKEEGDRLMKAAIEDQKRK